jgi:cell division protein FtsI (penicillin-binding protein 3)
MVWGMMLLAMVGLSFKLAQLQLVKGPSLKAMAEAQQKDYLVPRAARRPMIDRLGNVLAVDQVVYTLYAHPILFKRSKAAIATDLAPVLEQPEADLLAQFDRQESGLKLATDVPEEVAQRIRRLRLDGLELLAVQQRFYPQQALLSQTVGYINLDGKAQAGLEYSLRDQLQYPAARGDTASLFRQTEIAKDSQKLQLTLDSRLQRVAQRDLEATVAQHRAKRGAVIVMDSHNGEILALAVTPTYDPNRYYEAELEAFKNWAISDQYEPGSTFKPINIAIALEEGKIGPEDYLYDEGSIRYDGWTIKNADYGSAGGRGSISITDILKYSSNVGMIHIMEKLDRRVFYTWLSRLGLGKPTGIELPAEATAQLKDQEQFLNSRIEAATTAFGQGFSLTPIKLVQLQAALANGGKLVTPHVVRGLVDQQGNLTWQPDHAPPQRLFSETTTQAVLKMMEAVVQDGSGKSAQIPGYRIGGKTGTAQKAAGGQYGSGRITSFVGILPIENPRYVVLAVIDEPGTPNAYGSTVAAPLVKSVMESLVVLAAIPPAEAANPADNAEPAANTSN